MSPNTVSAPGAHVQICDAEWVIRRVDSTSTWGSSLLVVGISEIVRGREARLTLRENVRAQLRVLVKRILRKHGYPPDKQDKATQTVLEQAALLSEEWAAVLKGGS